MIGVHVVAKCFLHVREVVLKGDSMSALSWCAKGRANSDLCSRPSLILIGIFLKYQINVCHVIHVPGEQNIEADQLSRGKSVDEVFGNRIRLLDYDSDGILELCRVGGIPSTDETFAEFWESLQRI